MADVLFNKIIRQEVSSTVVVKWLASSPQLKEEDEQLNELLTGVTQIDFVTYFLNFLHEEVPCNGIVPDTGQNTPKRLEKYQSNHPKCKDARFRVNLFPEGSNNGARTGTSQTPKASKQADTLNEVHFSPVSPLYQNPFIRDTKQKSGNSNKTSLCLGDFLVNQSKSSTKKKRLPSDIQPRRIKPTKLGPKLVDDDFHNTQNSFDFQKATDNKEVSIDNATEQRSLLVEESAKIDVSSYSIPLKRHTSSTKTGTKPLLKQVTLRKSLDQVVDIYKTVLDKKLVLNLTSELYFLISALLSTKQRDDNAQNNRINPLDSNCTDEIPQLFETVHNVVYFAAKCLDTQATLVKLLDKATIKLLAENERTREFSPGLARTLQIHIEKCSEKSYIETIASTVSESGNVCFNIDTDNKENFPDQSSFHAFRKQRDLFYDILRVWETYHLVKDWEFPLGLGGKIRTLFSLHTSAANFLHLARLFKNQLLSSCARNLRETGLPEKSISSLPPLPIDANKFNRLTSRLTTKQASNGINSPPTFSGYQEFFHDFIIVASNYSFLKHLSDVLIADIVELNDTKFTDTNLEEIEEGKAEQAHRNLYLSCIKNLRILAKFLGFIESLPYRLEGQTLSKDVLEAYLKVREQSVPPLNVERLLRTSIEESTVVLTVPWVAKYLGMLDYVTLRLPYYKSVRSILYRLNRNYSSDKAPYNAAVVRFSLGWLFELSHFPEGDYFDCYYSNLELDQRFEKRPGESHLDQINIVDQCLLYVCCPFLEELKKLLSENAPGSKISAKYITPVTAVEAKPGEMTRKKLEQQLDETFFNSQPASLRKTVEFVAERVASTIVKRLCHEVVPKAKEEALKELKVTLPKVDSVENFNEDAQRKVVLKQQASSIAETNLTALRNACDKEMEDIMERKIPSAIDGLLPVDALDQTKEVAVEISRKMCAERVKQWLIGHVNLALFSKEFDGEIAKICNGRRLEKDKIGFWLPGNGRTCDHDENALSGFHTLNNLRETCCRIIERDDISVNYVVNVLQDAQKSVTQRNDVNDSVMATAFTLLTDLCVPLVTNYPELLLDSSEIMDVLLNLWESLSKFSHPLKNLLSPRKILMLQEAQNKERTWDAYARIAAGILQRELMDEEDVETLCTGFYNKEWDEDTLRMFSRFLKNLATFSGNTDNRFSFLLEFLSDYCVDL